MSKVQGLSKTIPPREIPFSFEGKGTFTGATYSGDFVVKVPGTKELSKMGVELAKLNNGVKFSDLDEGTAILHNAIAYLSATLIESPNWFTEQEENFDLDVNIPVLIFAKAEQLVTEWKNEVMGTKNVETKTKSKQSVN